MTSKKYFKIDDNSALYHITQDNKEDSIIEISEDEYIYLKDGPYCISLFDSKEEAEKHAEALASLSERLIKEATDAMEEEAMDEMEREYMAEMKREYRYEMEKRYMDEMERDHMDAKKKRYRYEMERD